MKRYFVFFLFLLSFLTTTSFVVAQSVLDITQEEVTQTLDISNSDKAIILNMGTNATSSDETAFYNAPEFDLLFRLKYNKATKDSWDTNWEATVRFRLVRIAGIYPTTNGVLDRSEITPFEILFTPFDDLGTLELKLNQSSIEDVNADAFSQVFVDYLVVGKEGTNSEKLPFDKEDLHNASASEPYTTAIIIEEIIVEKDIDGDGVLDVISAEETEGYMPVVNGSQDPIISFEVTPKPREVYGKVGNFVDAEELSCNTDLCYREEFEELVWKKIDNAHFYDLEWVFIDKYDSKTITTAAEAFARRRGVRIRTSDRHYLVRLGTELTYPEGRIFFRIRGIGKLKPEEDSEVLITTGSWNYGSKYLHLGADYRDDTPERNLILPLDSPIRDNIFYKNSGDHEANRNWQYATVFAEEGKYKKVMSYFDPSLRSTQTLTNFTTDASNIGNDVTLVEESFYDYEGRAVVQTIPAPLHTASLAHQSVNHDRVNFFVGNDKGKYDNLANPSPALDGASLTASYYSANPVQAVDFSTVDKFKHQDFVPISNGFAYTQVRYTNDGTGRVKAQSGVGEAFQMGGGKEVKTFYLNPSEEELRRLFGNELGDISHYKKILTIDPNGQKSVAYIDQAGQTIATGLVGDAPEQLRELEAVNIPDFRENLIKSNQRTGTVSRTEHTFYNPETNDYILQYSVRGGTTSLMEEGVELCLVCEYELEINIIDEEGLPINPVSINAVSNAILPHVVSFTGEDVEEMTDCDNPGPGETIEGAINIILSGLPEGEYTIIKELRLTKGEEYITQISDFADALMTQTSERFLTASADDASEKAEGDCLECTEVIEEDGTITQLATSNDCEYPDTHTYTPADFHNLVTEQMKDQCELDQNRYVLDPNGDGQFDDEINLDEDQTQTELEDNYERIPLCILCVDENQEPAYSTLPQDQGNTNDPTEREIKRELQNSYLYDSYMRGIKSRELDAPFAATGRYIDRIGTETERNFGNPMGIGIMNSMDIDPFWALFSTKVGTDISVLQARWINLITNNGGNTLDQLIASHINYDGNDADSEPDLSEEDRKEQSWLIFQGFYQNFKRAHLKVFYQKMTEHSVTGERPECDPTAIDILLPELAGTNNINLAGLTLNNLAYTNPAIFGTPTGEEDQWEKTWLGYTGTANCTDWTDNMTVLLETKLGQCSQKWTFKQYTSPTFTETQAIELRERIKEQFALYCGYQNDQPLANAFKKLYYSPYVKYDWLEDVSPLLDDQDASYYVGIYNDVITNNPTYASELTIAFEVHFGTGYLSNSDAEWNQEYSTDEQKNLVRAYVESMIRAVSPTDNLAFHDNNVDDYSEDINAALDAIKSEIKTLDPSCIGAFYAMLSVPDCKTHTYQEVEVPADATDLPVQIPVLSFTEQQTLQEFIEIRDIQDLHDSKDKTSSFMIELVVNPDLPVSPPAGSIFPILNTGGMRFSNGETIGDSGFDDGDASFDLYYYYDGANYRIQHTINVREDDRMWGGPTEHSIPITITDCDHILITEELNPSISGNDTRKIYYNGQEIDLNIDVIQINLLGHVINSYDARLFPILLGTNIGTGNNFVGTMRELRVWKRTNDFDKSQIDLYRKKPLPASLELSSNLLGYWKLDDYKRTGNDVVFKDYSVNQNNTQPHRVTNGNEYILPTTVASNECFIDTKPTIKKFLYTCDQAYTFGDGVDLWGGRPLTPPTAEELQADCERITTDLLGDFAERLLVKQKEVIEAKVEEEYRNQCFESPFKETMTLIYAKKEYHYTLYYYDQAGNLVQTVPPEGVDVLTISQLESNALLELNSPAYENPDHNLKTKYTYNTLGQVVWQETPDAGQSKFWIDYYGRVKLSQNAEQNNHNDYAYSKFDELGRPYEVGKLNTNIDQLDGQVDISADIEELTFDSNFPIAVQNARIAMNNGNSMSNVDFTLSERTKTFYDIQEVLYPNGIDFIVNPNEQKNLKNRVAAVVVIEAEKTSEEQDDQIGAVTRYSYDIHGNVDKLWQQLPELSEKTVEYNYDLLSGKVNEVIYNRDEENDEFRHRYSYDGDNRLTEVETSLDGYHWTREASYFYYAHGPLARIETGEHNLQGTDYFYTLQGWIKGVNSIGLNADRDLGKDGAEGSTFSKDEYAYALNYYNGDYNARGGNASLGGAFVKNEQYGNFANHFVDELDGNATYRRESLYNGNIAAMTTSIKHFGENDAQSMNYRYDQLHRIAAAEASTWDGNNWAHTTGGKYRTSYKYDANGNIKKLYRNNGNTVTPQRIDEITYEYIRNSEDKLTTNNRLLSTTDAAGLAEGGLESGETYAYIYDDIGNLVKNEKDGIESIEWNIYGKVEKVTKTRSHPLEAQIIITYKYDGTGNRIMKKVDKGTTIHTNYYLRDASGNVLAIYEDERPSNTTPNDNIAVKEIPIYGSSRLGQYRPFKDELGQVNEDLKTALGQRIYEFSNHLGNVLVTLTDNKVPQTDGTYKAIVLSASDYYPFGMAMKDRSFQNNEYRFAFQGQERDEETGTDHYTYRQADPIIGRFWSLDPLSPEYPHNSPYAFSENRVIDAVELEGLEKVLVNFDTGVDKSVVSEYTLNVIRDIAIKANIKNLTITSTYRAPERQMKAMYNNLIKKDGVSTQKELYGSSGDKVIDAFVAASAVKGATGASIQAAMLKKAEEVGFESNHSGSSYEEYNVVDISYKNLTTKEYNALKKAANDDDRISEVLGKEEGDAALHLEISVSKDVIQKEKRKKVVSSKLGLKIIRNIPNEATKKIIDFIKTLNKK